MGIAERNIISNAVKLVELEQKLHQKELSAETYGLLLKEMEDFVIGLQNNPELHIHWNLTVQVFNQIGLLKNGEITRFQMWLQPLYSQMLLYLGNTEMLS